MKLLPQVREIFELIAQDDLADVFGHAAHAEIYEMAELVQRLGIRKAFVDHPFSPFVALSVAQMKELTGSGIYMNFTFDELSPLLGLNPAVMCSAIQELGTEYVTLSSDCGEPLFPNSVEAMRQIRAYMCAFGLSHEEVNRISITNPGKIVGVVPSGRAATGSGAERIGSASPMISRGSVPQTDLLQIRGGLMGRQPRAAVQADEHRPAAPATRQARPRPRCVRPRSAGPRGPRTAAAWPRSPQSLPGPPEFRAGAQPAWRARGRRAAAHARSPAE
jgi:Family of unknown function (DUF6282)